VIHEEPAEVIAVEHGTATVEMRPSPGCGSCGRCSAEHGGKMKLTLDAIEGVEVGQTVVVAVDRAFSVMGALMLFGLPLAGLIGGVLLGQAWSFPGLSADASSAVFGVFFTADAFIMALIFERKVAAKRIQPPRIVRIESR